MKLIIIYGPPAAGKLTVANEVAKRTGFKVFHNHLSIDAIEPVFDFGTRPFFKLVEMIRVETIAEAARENVDLIYTFCYAKDEDDEHIRKITAAAEDNGGEVLFVLLICDKVELERRVLTEDRKAFGKAKTVEMMRGFFENYDLFSPVPDRASLIIDNTELSADKAAEQIMEHFRISGMEAKPNARQL